MTLRDSQPCVPGHNFIEANATVILLKYQDERKKPKTSINLYKQQHLYSKSSGSKAATMMLKHCNPQSRNSSINPL